MRFRRYDESGFLAIDIYADEIIGLIRCAGPARYGAFRWEVGLNDEIAGRVFETFEEAKRFFKGDFEIDRDRAQLSFGIEPAELRKILIAATR